MKRIFTASQVQNYGQLISDMNPIHQQSNDEHSPKKVIVHGMFSASVFSSIFGTLIPGSLYRSQTLTFNAPVYSDEDVIGRVEVTKVKDLRKGLLVTCDTSIYQHNVSHEDTKIQTDSIEGMTRCVQGVAEVWIPGLKL